MVELCSSALGALVICMTGSEDARPVAWAPPLGLAHRRGCHWNLSSGTAVALQMLCSMASVYIPHCVPVSETRRLFRPVGQEAMVLEAMRPSQVAALC